MRWQLRSKIHRAIVTEANLNYAGSITIDPALMEKAGFMEGERVLVASYNTGDRIDTYIIKGNENSGTVAMNGPAAIRVKKGEEIVIMGFELSNEKIKPKIISLDGKNNFVKYMN